MILRLPAGDNLRFGRVALGLAAEFALTFRPHSSAVIAIQLSSLPRNNLS